MSFFAEARAGFHAALMESVLRTDAKGIPSNADKDSKTSVQIARGILDKIGTETRSHQARLAGQMAGAKFEKICAEYLKETFLKLMHLRPGTWEVGPTTGSRRLALAQFDQYEHLAALDAAAKSTPELAVALGSDYIIKPDVIIVRYPVEDTTINASAELVDEVHARLTSVRKINGPKPTLHASVSCKWTLRSDRAQNSRSEALNLVRNRKGKLPHVVVVTGEPMPSRIASIALGTGEIDCVYHFALPELVATAKEVNLEDSQELLNTMIGGKRLRDIADLPLDLVI